MKNPLTRVMPWYRGLTGLQRAAAHAALALLAGPVIVPWFVYLAGRSTLGNYGGGGPFALWGDFLRGLAEPSLAYWFAALGPLALLVVWKLWRKITS